MIKITCLSKLILKKYIINVNNMLYHYYVGNSWKYSLVSKLTKTLDDNYNKKY